MKLQVSLILLAALLSAADDPIDEATKKDAKAFQGTWVLLSAERDGKKVSKDGGGVKLIITAAKYALTEESAAVIGHRGTYTLNAAVKPKTTDVTVTEGPDKGKTFPGIYELSGDDYKVCFAPPGKERPKEFAAPAGSSNLLQIWKREKSK